MNSEQVESIIKFGMLIAGAVTAIIIPLWKYLSYKEIQAKENSFGATKVKEYEVFALEMKTKLSFLVEKVERLSDQYEELIRQITRRYIDKQ